MTKNKCLVCLDSTDPERERFYKPPQERITVDLIKDTLVIIDGFTLYRDEIVINFCPKCGRDVRLENNQKPANWERDRVIYATGDCKFKKDK